MIMDGDGVALCTAAGDQQFAAIVSTVPAAIVAWKDLRNGVADQYVYARRIDASGNPQWTANGIALCTAIGSRGAVSIISDGAGGAIVTWEDGRAGNFDIYARRIDAAGQALWNPDGNAISAVLGHQMSPATISDGAGGAIVAWESDLDIHAGRIDSFGNPLWGASGRQLCIGLDFQISPRIVTDGAGGAIVAWQDNRSGAAGIYARRVDASGTQMWTANGVALCTAQSNQDSPSIVSDGAGGAIVAWSDARSLVGRDIYARRVDAAGNALWIADGVPLCAATGDQLTPEIASDGAGGAIVGWTDSRSGTDVYAQRVASTGQWVSFVVVLEDDDGAPGTLRRAIEHANLTPGVQVIKFNIPGSYLHVLAPYYNLPAITDPVVIDGFTQPGASANTNPVGSPSNATPQICVDGYWYGLYVGFDFLASATMRGMTVIGFETAVLARAPGVVLEGNVVRGNLGSGIAVIANNCSIGGATPASRNVITGNYGGGIVLNGVTGAKIYGNYIGVEPDGVSSAGNNYAGISLAEGVTGARIGSSVLTDAPNPQEANIIANNTQFGVVLADASCANNLIIGNSIHDNGTLGIDLFGDGITDNDDGDGDDGPNELQNWPYPWVATGTTVSGEMYGAPNSVLFLHFYRSPQCAGQGDAQAFIGGMKAVVTDNNGYASYTFIAPRPIPPASLITATATDDKRNTSELSWCAFSTNTPGGSGAPVDLVDANGNVYGTATFGSVTGTGNTYITNPYTPPVPVSGYAIGNPNDPQIYFNITTDASYAGGVDVCLNYDENNIPGPEANLVLLHYNGSAWEDVTTSRDLVNNRVCGHVASLSPFVLGAVTSTGVGDTPVPSAFALHPNVPNPFNPQTTISFDIPAAGADVNIAIYDVAGRLVRELVNERRNAGRWSVQWNGEDDRGQRVASGVYFYRMRAGAFVDTKKMVLLK
jgi:hypothetical protein